MKSNIVIVLNMLLVSNFLFSANPSRKEKLEYDAWDHCFDSPRDFSVCAAATVMIGGLGLGAIVVGGGLATIGAATATGAVTAGSAAAGTGVTSVITAAASGGVAAGSAAAGTVSAGITGGALATAAKAVVVKTSVAVAPAVSFVKSEAFVQGAQYMAGGAIGGGIGGAVVKEVLNKASSDDFNKAAEFAAQQQIAREKEEKRRFEAQQELEYAKIGEQTSKHADHMKFKWASLQLRQNNEETKE